MSAEEPIPHNDIRHIILFVPTKMISPTKLIPHDGGPCPASPHTPVRPVYRGEENPARKWLRITFAPAGQLDWSHDGGPDDIVGYYIAGCP